MKDEQLITRLCDTIDTLSRGGAEQAIRIVREHDRRHDADRDPDWPRLIKDDHPEGCPCMICVSKRARDRARARDDANRIARIYANE